MVSCQKGPTRHAYAWQIGAFWQDTLEICLLCVIQAKCEYYWPEADGPEEVVHGKFKVRAVKTEQYADYAIRTLSVTYKVNWINSLGPEIFGTVKPPV